MRNAEIGRGTKIAAVYRELLKKKLMANVNPAYETSAATGSTVRAMSAVDWIAAVLVLGEALVATASRDAVFLRSQRRTKGMNHD